MLCSAMALAQPENPSFSLTSTTYVEVDMKSIALLDIETGSATTNFSMDVPAITEAGLSLAANPLATNSDNWLNFSCVVRDVTSRKIQVSINTGTMPAGLELKLDVGGASGLGGGALGTPSASTLTIGTSPQDIVTGIRGAFTGDGANNGYQLSYSLHYAGSNFNQLDAQNAQVTLLYTIIDN